MGPTRLVLCIYFKFKGDMHDGCIIILSLDQGYGLMKVIDEINHDHQDHTSCNVYSLVDD